MLITFEGIDGSGKTTQVDLLCKRLDVLGIEYYRFCEPSNSKIGKFTREIAKIPNVSSNVKAALFFAARHELAFPTLSELLYKGKLVILDRYFDSTSAYQGLHHQKEYNYFPQPDLTFYIKITVEESKKRLLERDSTLDYSGLCDNESINRIIDNYDGLAKRLRRFEIIDGSESQIDIADKILNIVREKLYVN